MTTFDSVEFWFTTLEARRHVARAVTEAWGSDEGVHRLVLREHGFVFHRDIGYTIMDAINGGPQGGHYIEHFQEKKMGLKNFPNPAFLFQNQRESITEIAQRKLGVTGLVPCRDAAAMVSFLPFLDTPYEITGRSGHIELCFGTMAEARKFFEKVRRSGDVEEAELRASTGARTRGRLVDEFGSGERLLENPRPRKIGRARGWNAQSLAASMGFSYPRGEGRSVSGIRYGRFTATSSGEGPSLYVGRDSRTGNWFVFESAE